ncbi:MAG: anhydro-N-acetylmuramic acid kinase [Chitinophagales bacterium]|nr:anhydro-N-acetylmuramic acid kinase [Chitinophagales bacterium]MDW8419212.1 anhydro-N-acetylmuramic acid kinase [Chitinophagales bacterium]
MDQYTVIGLMSGSSLDGLDIACCTFTKENNRWTFRINHTDVVPYPDEWVQELRSLPIATAKKLWEAHAALGAYFGQQVNRFMERNGLRGKVDFIGSHGHTIFHFPEKKFTTQIGDGAALAATVNLPVVCDFRSADIADGGQGTPIVPIADKLLFAEYKYCLNIGGIANISSKTDDNIIAFDICPANQVLNLLANRLGKEYDEDGKIAAEGKVCDDLLRKLNSLDYYSRLFPKSLDNSFTRETILPLIEEFQISTEDKISTFTEHIASQINNHLALIQQHESSARFRGQSKILATGGGAFNRHLIHRIKHHTGVEVVVPDPELVKYKEALAIAFMAVLRMRNEVNVLRSVTGAARDSVGGAVFRP